MKELSIYYDMRELNLIVMEWTSQYFIMSVFLGRKKSVFIQKSEVWPLFEKFEDVI